MIDLLQEHLKLARAGKLRSLSHRHAMVLCSRRHRVADWKADRPDARSHGCSQIVSSLRCGDLPALPISDTRRSPTASNLHIGVYPKGDWQAGEAGHVGV
jgi:hypothetical protein